VRKIYTIITCLAAVIVVLDQWTKQIALNHLQVVGQTMDFLSWWKWTLVHNHGIVFGILNPPPPWLPEILAKTVLFILPFVVLGFVWWAYVKHFKDNEIFRPITVGLILGGAMGNIIDRLRFGYVVDFVDWFYPSASGKCIPLFYSQGANTCHWPVFNLADAAVSTALVLVTIEMFFLQDKYAEPKEKSQ